MLRTLVQITDLLAPIAPPMPDAPPVLRQSQLGLGIFFALLTQGPLPLATNLSLATLEGLLLDYKRYVACL
jgi:hypothetical protein